MPPRVRKSPLWDHYTYVDGVIAKCNICKTSIRYRSSTSNLKKHLDRLHPTVLIVESENPSKRRKCDDSTLPTEISPPINAPRAQQSELTAGPSTENEMETARETTNLGVSVGGSMSTRQTKISSFVPQKISDRQKIKINEQFLKLFTLDYQPFSIVEDDGFKAFVRELNPSFELPSRKKISKQLIPARYEEAKIKLATLLSSDNARALCLSTDCWTSLSNDSFIAVMVHFIYKGKLLNLTIDCSAVQKSHTSENLAEIIRNSVDTWGLYNRIIFSVSDNAPNITNALKNHLRFKHMGCAAHKLHLIVEKGLEEKEIAAAIEKAKKIALHFKLSTKSWHMLRDCQKKEGINPPKRVINSMPTRWNSTFAMLKRLSELQIPLRTAIAQLNVEVPVLSPAEWKVVTEICQVLQPFNDITQHLSSQKFPTASGLIPMISGLSDVLDKFLKDDDFRDFSPSVKRCVQNLQNEIKRPERFGGIERSVTLAVSTFLDPRFKMMGFKDKTLAEDAKKRTKEFLMSKIQQEEDQPEDSSQPEEEAVDKLSIWHTFINSANRNIQPSRGKEAKAIVELQRYIEEGRILLSENPISWWAQNKLYFPNLYKVAEEKLCVVSTSVSCEQLFSKAGMILSKRRCQLSAEKAQMLLFLNSNERILSENV